MKMRMRMEVRRKASGRKRRGGGAVNGRVPFWPEWEADEPDLVSILPVLSRKCRFFRWISWETTASLIGHVWLWPEAAVWPEAKVRPEVRARLEAADFDDPAAIEEQLPVRQWDADPAWMVSSAPPSAPFSWFRAELELIAVGWKISSSQRMSRKRTKKEAIVVLLQISIDSGSRPEAEVLVSAC